MKVKIDENLCIGCNTCEATCPKVFKLNQEKFKAGIIQAETDEECATVAAKMCPVRAIMVE